ncbi:MAG: methionine synthase [Pseudonocardiaceae bacterium]|nr:methionine synthase [Pseudonocardiaceae bacterium]
MSELPTGVFRAEGVGSLLRPHSLKSAMERDAPAGELRALQDAAVDDMLGLQAELGLDVVGDGELRRRIWHEPVLAVADGFDPTGFVRTWTDESGRQVSHTSPVVNSVLRRRGSVLDTEVRYVLDHTDFPIKVTLPVPSNFLSYWSDGVSGRAYSDRAAFLDDLVEIMNAEARALAQAGVRYLQLDAPKYTFLDERRLFPDPDRRREQLAEYVRADRRVFDGLHGVTTGLHICRGNYRSMWESAVPYEEFAETLFAEARYDRLLLEYDDVRAGGFEALRFVPEDTTAVLGLVTTKSPELENADDLRRRIDEAARFVPHERLALSPQCGFASTWEGNELTADDQRRKLELVVTVARKVWG